MIDRKVSIIIAGFLTIFVAFAIRYAYGLLLPYMISSLAISKTSAGIIYSSYFITYTLFAPVLGFFADRYDAKGILTVFVILLGLGAFLMSYSRSVIHASFFFALAGIGHSACWAPVVTVVMRWVSEKHRGIILSIVDLGSATGIAVWSIIIPLIIGVSTWRTAWVCLGICAFLVAGLNFLVIKSHPTQAIRNDGSNEPQKPEVPVRAVYRAIFRDSKFYLIGFSYLLISFSILVPFTFLTAYATRVLMMPYSSATGLVAVIAVAGAIGKLIMGHISDKTGRIRIMMFCGLITAIGCIGMIYAEGYAILIIFTALFGIGYGTIWPVYAASGRDLFPAEYSGSVIGFWTLYHGFGSMLSPVLSGYTIDKTDAYVWAFVLAAIGSVLSFALLLPLKGTAAKK